MAKRKVNKREVYTTERGLYHAIARCQDCSFQDDNYLTAVANGSEHCIETGHTLDMEQGYLLKRITIDSRLERLGIKLPADLSPKKK